MATTTSTLITPTADHELASLPRPPPCAAKLSGSNELSSLPDEEAASPPDDNEPPEGVTFFTSPDVSTVKGKLTAASFSLFLAGFNDGATGALIPYLQPAYNIGLTFVALVYLCNFAGWTLAAFTNVHLTARLGTAGVLLIGSALQLVAYALLFWMPPYPLFVISFFINGLGMAYQDAQANTFVGNVQNAHFWLGLLHASYGAGALISPLIATAIATHSPKWHYFYLVCLGLGLFNASGIAYGFWGTLKRGEGAGHEERSNAAGDLKKTLSNRTVLLLSLFFFLYVGTEVTAGGWVVTYLISVRHGAASQVGYVASGFWGGLTAGRLVLPLLSHRISERVSIFVYVALALACELMFWFIPSIIANAVVISLLGFFIGPFFPTGISVATKLLPRELHVAAIGFAATTGAAGSAAFPFLTGALAGKVGVQVLQPVLVGLLAGQAVVWALIPKVKRRTV